MNLWSMPLIRKPTLYLENLTLSREYPQHQHFGFSSLNVREAFLSFADDNNRLVLENTALKQDLKKAMDLNAQTLNLSKGMDVACAIWNITNFTQLPYFIF